MSQMSLFALGLNYRTAPIEVRERVTFPLSEQRAALDALRIATGAPEATLVSTCNRTELYLRATHLDILDRAANWLSGLSSVRGIDISSHLCRLTGAEVPRHAFRVASGLDSMILGEPQVLGQLKLAVKIASDAKALSGPLDRLFQETFQVAKAVRSQTAIGTSSVSMVAAAAKIASQLFGDMRASRVLLVGTGEMIQLAATHFAAMRPKAMVIANRTLEKAEALAKQHGASAMTLEELPSRIYEFDAVITSTASMLPIIGKGMIERALNMRKRKPIFLVDLAVPRDIEPEVQNIDDVYLYTLDSLGHIIEQNLGKRQAAIVAADAIIDSHTTDFMRWLGARASVPLVQKLKSYANDARMIELEKAQKMLARGQPPATVLAWLANGLTNKLLHQPLSALGHCSPEERDNLLAGIDKLYLRN